MFKKYFYITFTYFLNLLSTLDNVWRTSETIGLSSVNMEHSKFSNVSISRLKDLTMENIRQPSSARDTILLPGND